MGPRLLRVDPDELDKMLTLIPTAAVSPISSRRTQPGRLTPVLAVVSRQLCWTAEARQHTGGKVFT